SAGHPLGLVPHASTQANGVNAMPAGPAPRARLHRTNDGARQRWVLDERRATATRRHAFRGAAHVDIHTIKAEGAEHVCHLVKPVRVGAIDLRQNGTLTLDKA